MAIDLGEDDALAEAGSATVATTWTTKVAEIISRAFHSETNQFGTAALRDVGNGEGNIRALNANGKIPQARVRIPERDFSADEFKDYGIEGIDFILGSITFREVANGAIPYTAFDIRGTPTEGARVIYNFEDGTLEWEVGFGNIVGEIQFFPHSATVAGWLPCDGRSLSRTIYARLFAAISTTYGNVDDDHFNLPDLSGRIVAEKGTTDAFNAIGKIGGTETHQLTEDEIPSHKHLWMNGDGGRVNTNLVSDDYPYVYIRHWNTGTRDWTILQGSTEAASLGLTSKFGKDKSHTNLQPYLVQEYRIFTGI